MAARLRVRGEIVRADTRDLTRLHAFEGYTDLASAVDVVCNIAPSASVTFDPTTYGLTMFEDCYVFTDTPIAVAYSIGAPYFVPVSDFMIMRGTTASALVLQNASSSPATVRVILGGN